MLDELKDLQQQGLITLRPNDSGNLLIANYTPKVQYDRLWTDTLKQCRGLIVDLDGNVIARPFPKFFNIEEHTEPLPNEPFEVYEKMDGSLGILYYENGFKIATRGSFNSEQAIKATKMLNERYWMYLSAFNPNYTYLFEIIYPENRIVCNYGDSERLCLLASIDRKTGEDISISRHIFPDKVARYDGITDLSKIKDFEDNEREGFVIRFKSGLRVKSKFSEYVRLHRIITQVSSKTIWEYLSEGKKVSELLDRVPDEFYKWVRSTSASLMDDFMQIDSCARSYFVEAPECETRKDFVDYALTKVSPHLLFALYDGKPIAPLIWKMIKPVHERPFKTDYEN